MSVPLHVKHLTIKTPYKNAKLFFFGIMSALARKEAWNTLSALRKEKIKGFACQLNDSTQNGKPPLHVCGSILPKTSIRRMNTWTAESKGTARGRGAR